MSKSNYHNRIYNINEHFFDAIDTEEKAYFLGFLYADGYNRPASSHVVISLQERDKEILEKLRDLIYNDKWELAYRITAGNRQNQYQLRFSSKYMSDKLVGWGCYPNKSLTLQFPTFISEELTPHFIRGVFDGDGSISLYQENNRGSNVMKASWSITSSYAFCKRCKDYLERRLDITPLLYQERNKIANIKTNSKKNIKTLMGWMYGDMKTSLYLERKHSKYLYMCQMLGNRDIRWEFLNKTRYKYNISETDEELLKDLYISGESALVLSKKFDISQPNVLQHLERLGVKRRPKSVYNLTPQQELTLIEDYKMGVTQSQLETKYHTSHRVVRKLLLLNNIPINRKRRGNHV
jgi:hypothetical protein